MRDPILPTLRRTAADAEHFARVVHEGHVDKAGRPYVEHLERVARAVALNEVGALPLHMQDRAEQIAWLHDVIEDTDYTSDDLEREGFSDDVALGVRYLTKGEKGMWFGSHQAPYAEWITWLCEDAPLPVQIVKLADIEDNSDPARLAALDEATRTRLERKYGSAKERLRAAIATSAQV